MLVGYGLYSLYRTKPGELAPGAETVLSSGATSRVVAKEQVQQWSKEAGEAAGQVREALAPTVRQVSADASEVVAKATGSVQELTTTGAEQVPALAWLRQARQSHR